MIVRIANPGLFACMRLDVDAKIKKLAYSFSYEVNLKAEENMGSEVSLQQQQLPGNRTWRPDLWYIP